MVLLGLSSFIYVANATPKETERLPKVSTEIVNRPFYDNPIPNEYHIVNAAYRFLGWSRDGRYFK